MELLPLHRWGRAAAPPPRSPGAPSGWCRAASASSWGPSRRSRWSPSRNRSCRGRAARRVPCGTGGSWERWDDATSSEIEVPMTRICKDGGWLTGGQGWNLIDFLSSEHGSNVHCSNSYTVGSKYWSDNWPQFWPVIAKVHWIATLESEKSNSVWRERKNGTIFKLFLYSMTLVSKIFLWTRPF